MPNARILPAIGAIDGVNVRFAVPEAFVPGSAAYILNGRIYSQFSARGITNPFGFFEGDPDKGEIIVDFPPVPGDVVQILYMDRKPTVEPTLTSARADVVAQDRVQAVVTEPKPTVIEGAVVPRERIQGVVTRPVPTRLVGIIRERKHE